MSSVSHQVACTKNVAPPTSTNPTPTTQIHRNRDRETVAARKNANTTPTIDIHRHGNCTNFSFGSKSQKIIVGRNIRNVAAAANSNIGCTTAAFSPPGTNRFPLAATTSGSFRDESAANPVSRINTIAVVDAIQLNSVCSGSFVAVYRKFSVGSNPADSACVIFTHRCSYAAGSK